MAALHACSAQQAGLSRTPSKHAATTALQAAMQTSQDNSAALCATRAPSATHSAPASVTAAFSAQLAITHQHPARLTVSRVVTGSMLRLLAKPLVLNARQVCFAP